MNTIPLSMMFGLLILLILMSGFFSGSETALMSLNRYRLRHLVKGGHKGAIRTAKLLQRPDRLISLILLGNNFVNILASAIATVIAMRLFGEPGIALATGLLTIVILVFAEVTPKTLATRKSEQIAFFASAVYVPLMIVAWPVVRVVNWTTRQLLALMRVAPADESQEELSSAELATVVNESAGLIPKRHRDMLINILDLEEISVDDIMVPRNDIDAIDLEDSWDEILAQISSSKHGRMVVFREHIDNIVGFIYLRKMLDTMRSGDFNRQALEERIREAYFIPEGTSLTVQLLNFQKEKRRIGLVVDEYGDIIGLLTLEDILEEIVGEFNIDPHQAPDEIQPQADGSFLVDGAAQIRNLNRILGWNLSADGPKTLNGIIVEHLENFPALGSVFMLHEHHIEVLELDDNRVSNVRITPVSKLDSVARDIQGTTQSQATSASTESKDSSARVESATASNNVAKTDKKSADSSARTQSASTNTDDATIALDKRSVATAEEPPVTDTHDDYPVVKDAGDSRHSRRVGNQRG